MNLKWILALLLATVVLGKRLREEEHVDLANKEFYFKSVWGTYLTANADRNTISLGPKGPSSLWVLVPVGHNTYRLKSKHGTYLVGAPHFSGVTKQSYARNAGTAWIVTANGADFTFRNVQFNTHLRGDPAKYANAASWCQAWEHWTGEAGLANHHHQKYYFRSVWGTYLTAAADTTTVVLGDKIPNSKWKLVRVDGDIYRLKSKHGTYLAGVPHFSGVTHQSRAKDDSTAWILTMNGADTTLRNVRFNTHLRGDPAKYANAASWCQAWEHWSAEPVVEVSKPSETYYFKSVWGTYLTASSDEKSIVLGPKDRLSKWTLEHVEGDFFRLKSKLGTYLKGVPHFSGVTTQSRTEDDSTIWLVTMKGADTTFKNVKFNTHLRGDPAKFANAASWCQGWEHWSAEPTEDHRNHKTYYFRSYHGNYLTANNNGQSVSLGAKGSLTRWLLVMTKRGYYRVRSELGTYLQGTPHNTGRVDQTKNKHGATKWILEEKGNYVNLKNVEHNTYLRADTAGYANSVSWAREWEQWNLEPAPSFAHDEAPTGEPGPIADINEIFNKRIFLEGSADKYLSIDDDKRVVVSPTNDENAVWVLERLDGYKCRMRNSNGQYLQAVANGLRLASKDSENIAWTASYTNELFYFSNDGVSLFLGHKNNEASLTAGQGKSEGWTIYLVA